MDNKDELIAKLERENSYLKSLLKQNGISYGEPKEIKQHNFSDDEKINLYLSVYQNGGRWCVDVKVNRKPGFEGLYSNSVYANQKDALKYSIENKIASLGLQAGNTYIKVIG